jgi:hypothetical protein
MSEVVETPRVRNMPCICTAPTSQFPPLNIEINLAHSSIYTQHMLSTHFNPRPLILAQQSPFEAYFVPFVIQALVSFFVILELVVAYAQSGYLLL